MYLFTNEGWQLEGGGFNQTNGGLRGPYPSTVYGFRMEKETWTAFNCHQACAICFVVRSK